MTSLVPYTVAGLGIVVLVLVLLDLPPRGGVQDERSTWWLLLLIALAGMAQEIARGENARYWQALAGAVLALALARAIRAGLRDRTVPGKGMGPWVAVVLVIWLFVVNALSNYQYVGPAVLARGLAMGFWVAFAVYLRVSRVTARMVTKAAVTLMALVAVLVGTWSEPWRACDLFKCGVYGALLRGPFASENQLGMLAGVVVILLAATPRSTWRMPGLVLAAAVLSATSSRTSMIALGLAGVFWLVSGSRGLGRKPRLLSGAYVVAILAIEVVSAVLISSAAQATLSNRGRIWTRAMEALDGPTWQGLGLDRWSVLQDAGLLPPLFPHSQLLLVYFSGGVVAGALYLAFLLSPLRLPGGDGRRTAMTYGVYLAVVGLAEVWWNPLTIDLHVAVLAPFLALTTIHGATTQRGARRAPGASPNRRPAGLPPRATATSRAVR